MKTFYFMLFLFFFTSEIILPQWYFQESGTTADLRGVWFVDSHYGWACGDSGIVLHTSNGGQVWQRQNSNVTVKLEDVFFWDLQTGWIVGDSGVIICTTDGGNNWFLQTSNVTSNLYKIEFLGFSGDPYDGLIVGDRAAVVFTTNGGLAWNGNNYINLFGNRTINTAIFKEISRWLFFVETSPNNVLSTIFLTINGGITWDTLSLPHIPLPLDIFSIVISGQEYFYWAACKNSFLLTSTDGGFSWRIGLIDIPDSTIDFKGITLDNDIFKLWAVGKNGKVVCSIDSGMTWQTISSGVSTDLNEVSFPALNKGWAVGDYGIIIHYNTTTSINETINFVIEELKVQDPYPNPFNPTTTIEYQIDKRQKIIIDIFNVIGQKAAHLVNEIKEPGTYMEIIDGSDLTSGLYFCRIQAGENVVTKKLILLK